MGVWVKLRGRKHGPFDDSQLQTMVRQGKIGRHNEVSLDGIQWMPASNYAPLYAALKTGSNSGNNSGGSKTEELSLAAESSASGNAATDVSKQWFVSSDGISGTGPYSSLEIIESLRLGKMSPSWLAWKEWGEAKSLNEYPEFMKQNSETVVEATVDNLSEESEKKYCPSCQYPMSIQMTFCPRCGMEQKKHKKSNATYSIKGAKRSRLVNCRFCGEQISAKLSLCPYCNSVLDESQRKPRLTYILFGLLLLGWFGGHNFYAGRKEIAVKQFWLGITIVGLPITIIWAIYDVFMIRKDGKGLPFIE